jgi:hypothetical protein
MEGKIGNKGPRYFDPRPKWQNRGRYFPGRSSGQNNNSDGAIEGSLSRCAQNHRWQPADALAARERCACLGEICQSLPRGERVPCWPAEMWGCEMLRHVRSIAKSINRPQLSPHISAGQQVLHSPPVRDQQISPMPAHHSRAASASAACQGVQTGHPSRTRFSMVGTGILCVAAWNRNPPFFHKHCSDVP